MNTPNNSLMNALAASKKLCLQSMKSGTAANIDKKVEEFLTSNNLVTMRNMNGNGPSRSISNESLSFDTAVATTGIERIKALVESCGIADKFVQPAMESVLKIMARSTGGASASWSQQNALMDKTSNNYIPTPLNSIYPQSIVSELATQTFSNEAFGVNIDMVVPDMKVAITVAMMNFHTRIAPRVMPTRSTTQPNVSYTKEYLEVYDLKDVDGKRSKLTDLYADPSFAKNVLTRIVPRVANETDLPTEKKALVADGIIKFGKNINILKMSIDPSKEGFAHINRTDLVEENVLVDFIRVSIVKGGTTELFDLQVPMAMNRLTRTVDGADSAIRNADLNFTVALRKGAMMTNGTASTLLGILKDEESFTFRFTIKPTVSLKTGMTNCLGTVETAIKHAVNDALISPDTVTEVALWTTGMLGYSLDARFSEGNLRKTSVAIMTHRRPHSYDIPIGRNYVFDYQFSQNNAEENTATLSKVTGIGQDRVFLDVVIKTLESVYDQLKVVGSSPDNFEDYVGANYVAGDKIRPSVFIGTLDYTKLNFVKDADRSGDIKEKALTFLNAAIAKVLQESYFQQQIGGSATATFKCITSIEILSNVLGRQHFHNSMVKEDTRDIGDGVEYVLVLPSGVKIEVVTSTFNDMRNKMILVPVVHGDPESELNFGHNWDYGTMIAHYSPSGEAAHHRLFANIRELPIVTCPIGLIIDVAGMDLVNGIAIDGCLRPTIKVEGAIATTVSGTVVTGPETTV